jgi:hypothetical protein
LFIVTTSNIMSYNTTAVKPSVVRTRWYNLFLSIEPPLYRRFLMNKVVV